MRNYIPSIYIGECPQGQAACVRSKGFTAVSSAEKERGNMKRVVMVSMVVALILVATAPAFANAVAGDVTLDFVDASQTQAAAAAQVNRGDADAGNLGSAAAIDQSLTVDQSQVNAGWDGVAAGGNIWWGW